MATFSPKDRLDLPLVEAEIGRLQRAWSTAGATDDGLHAVLDRSALEAPDLFDRVQLAYVAATCRSSRSLSEAGRTFFAASRTQKTSTNDADRLRKYFTRFDLEWATPNGR